MIRIEAYIAEVEWEESGASMAFDNQTVHVLQFIEEDFFVEPEGKNQVKIQFGRGHILLSRKKFLNALFEYNLMHESPEKYIEYKEKSLLKKCRRSDVA